MKHSGFLFKLDPTDFVTGASPLVIPEVNTTADWRDYLPTTEKQYKNATFDTMSCTTFSLLNIIETWVNWHIAHDNFTQKQLEKLKTYYIDGKINFADRYTAIMSKTMPNGNYFQSVLDSVRKDGLIPETVFPFGGNSWAEYHNPSNITQAMKDQAKGILDILEVSYEWVTDNVTIPNDLKQCPIQGAIPEQASHAVEIVAPTYYFDTYEPFVKSLPFVKYAMKVIVTVKPEVVRTLKFGMKGEDVKELQSDLKALGYSVGIVDGIFGNLTTLAVKAFQKANMLISDGIVGKLTLEKIKQVKKNSKTLISKFAMAIQNHEGYFNGSRSYRNNSPANFKTGGTLTPYMQKLGGIALDKDNFVIFPTYQVGFTALCTFLTDACNNKLKRYTGDMDLFQFFQMYAPSSDHNDPYLYAKSVAGYIGVAIETKISEFLKVDDL